MSTDYSAPTEVKCWWAPSESAPLEPGTITRRAMTDNDVVIAIKYAGICHSDIHMVRLNVFVEVVFFHCSPYQRFIGSW